MAMMNPYVLPPTSRKRKRINFVPYVIAALLLIIIVLVVMYTVSSADVRNTKADDQALKTQVADLTAKLADTKEKLNNLKFGVQEIWKLLDPETMDIVEVSGVVIYQDKYSIRTVIKSDGKEIEKDNPLQIGAGDLEIKD